MPRSSRNATCTSLVACTSPHAATSHLHEHRHTPKANMATKSSVACVHALPLPCVCVHFCAQVIGVGPLEDQKRKLLEQLEKLALPSFRSEVEGLLEPLWLQGVRATVFSPVATIANTTKVAKLFYRLSAPDCIDCSDDRQASHTERASRIVRMCEKVATKFHCKTRFFRKYKY